MDSMLQACWDHSCFNEPRSSMSWGSEPPRILLSPPCLPGRLLLAPEPQAELVLPGPSLPAAP